MLLFVLRYVVGQNVRVVDHLLVRPEQHHGEGVWPRLAHLALLDCLVVSLLVPELDIGLLPEQLAVSLQHECEWHYAEQADHKDCDYEGLVGAIKILRC